MKITTVRRICQAFFLLLFLFFCVATTVGAKWFQLRGWPVNFFLQADPLVALATVLTTGTLYGSLLAAGVTLVGTILLGRAFCGWVCPFGVLHQFVGYLGRRGKPLAQQIGVNRYRKSQSIKYYILLILLAAAGGGLVRLALSLTAHKPAMIAAAAGAIVLLGLLAAALQTVLKPRTTIVAFAMAAGAFAILAMLPAGESLFVGSIQTGLLDPIPLVYRSVNMALLPMIDATTEALSPLPRLYELSWLVGGVFVASLALNLWIPRFYCRFVCPLGALLGLLGRWAIFRVGKNKPQCLNCGLCEANCEGACQPTTQIRTSECVLCLNCLPDCRHGVMTYQARPSRAGEIPQPDLSRRGVLAAMAAGLASPVLMRLGGQVGPNWNASLIRPPGALAEPEFLQRCIKCGQCMRVCPTNVLQPASLQGGLEGVMTPILNNRIGSSGCQLNCVACGNICPTAAIRPITLDEKLGRGEFAGRGPIKLGTAFVDRSRCLPWVFNKPCIVCQENCPVSPKAIYVREDFQTVRGGQLKVQIVQGYLIEIQGGGLRSGVWATGDYFIRLPDGSRKRIAENSNKSISIAKSETIDTPPEPGATIEVQVRLQRPFVDADLCIGCGTCEHECPVSGLRAIRITAEGETRSDTRSLLV